MRRAGPFFLALTACAAKPAPVPAEPPAPPTGGVPSDALPATNLAPGTALDLDLALVDGGRLSLATLRGRVVLLEIETSGHADAAALHARWLRLQQELGAAFTVVVVSMDSDPLVALDAWGPSVTRVALAADPQGAVAARFQVAKVPTVLLVDRQGVLREVYGGLRAAGAAAVEDRARALVQAPGARP
jgi:hypothetical protein